MRRESYLALFLTLMATGLCAPAGGVEETAPAEPSAAELVRAVYAAEEWIREVDSCLIRTEGVQSEQKDRGSTPAPSAAEFEGFRRHRDWQETQRWTGEIAWDRRRVRSLLDSAESRFYMVTAWDGEVMTVHQRAPPSGRESYGRYNDSRKHVLASHRVNLWDYGGLVTNDRNAWWRSSNPEEGRRSTFQRPEDFSLVGRSRVGRHECHVVESRAGRVRLYIDTDEHRVRRMTHFGVPNDLDGAVRLAAMRRATGVELATPRDWRGWLQTVDPERRLAAKRRLGEELFPSTRIRYEVYPGDYGRVAAGGWLPRRFTRISSYPDWDVVETTGRYTYKVTRVDIEVTELKVNEPLPDEALTITIPDGGTIYDWRFDPPVEYEFRADRTAEDIRALAEEARRKRDAETAPYREMVAGIEPRVGQQAPELPGEGWFNSAPLKLGDLRGKVVLLNFWATWCAPCHEDTRTLVTLNKSPASDPLVIGVHDAKADAGAVRRAIAETGIRYPVCIDAQGDAESDLSQRSWYRIGAIPYTILIDKEGRVAGHGTLDEMLERATELE